MTPILYATKSVAKRIPTAELICPTLTAYIGLTHTNLLYFIVFYSSASANIPKKAAVLYHNNFNDTTPTCPSGPRAVTSPYYASFQVIFKETTVEISKNPPTRLLSLTGFH